MKVMVFDPCEIRRREYPEARLYFRPFLAWPPGGRAADLGFVSSLESYSAVFSYAAGYLTHAAVNVACKDARTRGLPQAGRAWKVARRWDKIVAGVILEGGTASFDIEPPAWFHMVSELVGLPADDNARVVLV